MPAFDAGYSFHIMAGHPSDDEGIHEVRAGQMAQPMFPVPIEAMQGEMTYQDFRAGEASMQLVMPPKSTAAISRRPIDRPVNHPLILGITSAI